MPFFPQCRCFQCMTFTHAWSSKRALQLLWLVDSRGPLVSPTGGLGLGSALATVFWNSLKAPVPDPVFRLPDAARFDLAAEDVSRRDYLFFCLGLLAGILVGIALSLLLDLLYLYKQSLTLSLRQRCAQLDHGAYSRVPKERA